MYRMILVTDDDAWKLTTPVEESEWTPEIGELARKVEHCLEINRGRMAALAANQIDIRHRIIAMPELGTMFNPKLETWSKENNLAWEGCFSIPDKRAAVERPVRVVFSGIDPQNGEVISWFLNYPNSRYALHELDHIDGILMTDRAIQTRENDDPPKFISQAAD